MPSRVSDPPCPRIRSAPAVPKIVSLALPPDFTVTATLPLLRPSEAVIFKFEVPVRPETVVMDDVRVAPVPPKVILLVGTRVVLDEVALRVRLPAVDSTSEMLRVILPLFGYVPK